MNQIVFLDAKTMGDMPEISSLKEFGAFTTYDETSPEQRYERCKNADIIITNKVVLDEELLLRLPNLKLICVAATGMNNIDLKKAAELNIPVKNVSGYSTNSVAQLTFGYMIELYNRVHYYDSYVKTGKYSDQKLFTHIGPGLEELAGKTLGIIGMGNIGKAVATIAKAFQMNIIYYSTSGKNTEAGYECVSFDGLLQRADVISIHAPLNDQTKNLFQQDAFAKMKPTSVIINVGRGGIINEDDLVKALNEHTIKAAALDVFKQEPLSADSPLLKLKEEGRLLLTPHIAWASKQARLKLLEGIKENIRSWISQQ